MNNALLNAYQSGRVWLPSDEAKNILGDNVNLDMLVQQGEVRERHGHVHSLDLHERCIIGRTIPGKGGLQENIERLCRAARTIADLEEKGVHEDDCRAVRTGDDDDCTCGNPLELRAARRRLASIDPDTLIALARQAR